MLDLAFEVLGAEGCTHSASPQINLRVAITARPATQAIDSILLRSIVRIQAGSRSHSPEERARLKELFGDESLWGRGSHSLIWAQATTVVSRFQGSTEVEVTLPCSYDLAATASKYLRAVHSGHVPVTVQLSGTVFYATGAGLQVTQIPWNQEATHALPVPLFRQAIEQHFPDAGVLSLRHDLFARLDRYRVAHGLATWDRAIEQLLTHYDDGDLA